MTKQDLVNTVAEQTGFPSYQVKEIVERSLDVIRDEVKGGEAVTIRGFGTFQIKQRKAKPARNISTGESVLVPAHKVVNFKPSKDFKIRG